MAQASDPSRAVPGTIAHGPGVIVMRAKVRAVLLCSDMDGFPFVRRKGETIPPTWSRQASTPSRDFPLFLRVHGEGERLHRLALVVPCDEPLHHIG